MATTKEYKESINKSWFCGKLNKIGKGNFIKLIKRKRILKLTKFMMIKKDTSQTLEIIRTCLFH